MTRRRKNETKPGEKPPTSAVRKSSRQMAKKQLEGQMNGDLDSSIERKEIPENKKTAKKGVRGRRKKVDETQIATSLVSDESSTTEKCDLNYPQEDSQEEVELVEAKMDECREMEVGVEEVITEETIICDVEEMEIETKVEGEEQIIIIESQMGQIDEYQELKAEESEITNTEAMDIIMQQNLDKEKPKDGEKIKKPAAKLREFSLFDSDEFKHLEKLNVKRKSKPESKSAKNENAKEVIDSEILEKQITMQIEEKLNLNETENMLPINKIETLILSDLENKTVKKEDFLVDGNKACNDEMVKTEKLNHLEEGSRDSEVEVKIEFDDVKVSSGSENSNDTLTSLSSAKVSDSNSDSKSSLMNDGSGVEGGANVRRSSRIRSIGLMNKRSHGRGLVSKPLAESPKTCFNQEKTVISGPPTPVESQNSTDLPEVVPERANNVPKAPSADCQITTVVAPPVSSGYDSDSAKPVKVKSRWRRSSELEMGNSSAISNTRTNLFTYNSTPMIPELRAFESVADGVGVPAIEPEKPVQAPISPQIEMSIQQMSVAETKIVNEDVTCGASVANNPTIYSTTSAQEAIGSKISLPNVQETDREMEERLSQFEHIRENLYLTNRYTNKEHKKMVCDCFITEDEIERGELGCGEDCLNRLLMIECGPKCNVGSRCTNRRFQNCEYAKCEVFRTEKKGFGLRATCDLEAGDFIMEYVGEVVDPKDFRRRAKEYSKDKNKHYYFMALKSDQIIDATMKGNVSRFINHSCEPNAETQKWTVNGELRIGFFNKKFITAGEEITFDYHFQRYGKEAQKCYCESPNCRGWIGDNPKKKQLLESDDDDDEEEEEDEEHEDEEEDEAEDEDEQVKEGEEKAKQKMEQKEKQVGELDEGDKLKEPKEKPLKVERKVKRDKVASRRKKEEKKPPDYMEDEDLEEEIDKLCAGGLKNRTHTLTLSRLMVRSRELEHRTRLLRVIQSGEQPCRRLFLDYHGLRLIWSYMMDLTDNSSAKSEQFRLEILKTLKTLPIPNKTMLMDSKVYMVVEKWAKNILTSPNDSPEDDQSKQKSNEDVESNGDSNDKFGMDKVAEQVMPTFDKDSQVEVKSEFKDMPMIVELAESLLQDWANLKEVFRIPKKERIEQMKEHEREADRGYREELEKEERRKTFSYERHRSSDRHHRVDSEKRLDRRRGRDSPDFEHNRISKDKRGEERTNLVPVRRMTKYERRQLFALKVAKEEEEKQRRQQQELWQEHEARCIALGIDPHTTAVVDSNTGFPLYFNQSLGQWQHYPMQENPEIPQSCAYLSSAPQVIAVHGPIAPSAHPSHPSLGQPTHPPLAQAPHPPLPPTPLGNLSSDLSGIPPPAALYTLNPPYAAPPAPYPYPESHHLTNNIVQIHNGTPQNLYETPTAAPTESQFQEPDAVMNEAPSLEIPPILDLPPKWKWAKDARGRTYYYHIRDRISQWLPPPPDHIGVQPDSSTSEESSDESSSTEEEDELEEEVDEERVVDATEDIDLESTLSDGVSIAKQRKVETTEGDNLVPETKKRRDGLVQERIISPRREENRTDHRKYKEYKEKLKRQKERAKLKEHIEKSREHLEKLRKHRRSNKLKSHARHASSKLQTAKSELTLSNERKIKDAFRINMANVMVHYLNPYRKYDCKQGRITNTEDFKHLARKLTHFVLAKELKHCKSVDELQCNENVKHKAKDFVRKYMNKFGPVYQKSTDED